MQPDSQPPAPTVVAVVVTCDPGPWLEQALSSLAAQDYPNVSVVVVDSASINDPTPAVEASLPGAFVWRLKDRVGFGRAANQVRQLVEGASHYLFCHDDVILAPDAVRLLLEEAFRSNSGIASPKYLQWEDPERLLSVGATADKVGVVNDLVDPGELDQEQHDSVREILVAPAGVTLVRADLFDALGGFDERFFMVYEDVDLSYRARLAGARVWYAADAIVRHAGSGSLGTISASAVFYGQRNLEWTWIKNTPPRLMIATALPHLIYSVAGVLHYIRAGRGGAAIRGKWAALGELPRVLAERRRVQATRTVDPSALESLMERRWFAAKRREKAYVASRAAAS
jgi:GT2 family glycosyltransferase